MSLTVNKTFKNGFILKMKLKNGKKQIKMEPLFINTALRIILLQKISNNPCSKNGKISFLLKKKQKEQKRNKKKSATTFVAKMTEDNFF